MSDSALSRPAMGGTANRSAAAFGIHDRSAPRFFPAGPTKDIHRYSPSIIRLTDDGTQLGSVAKSALAEVGDVSSRLAQAHRQGTIEQTLRAPVSGTLTQDLKQDFLFDA
jgi:hypothetical protein